MLERACKWAKIQRAEANSMTLAWPRSVGRWRKMLFAFKQDQRKPNPFLEPDDSELAWMCPRTLKLSDSQVIR